PRSGRCAPAKARQRAWFPPIERYTGPALQHECRAASACELIEAPAGVEADAAMSRHTPARSEAQERWHEAADVVVVGYGYAGAVAAIEAHDAGADVLLIEKMPDPGGISITSGGNVRIVEDAEEGFRHLQATNAATTPDPVLRALAAGMADIPAYFEKLAQVSGATINRRQADAHYPFAGTETLGDLSIDHVP